MNVKLLENRSKETTNHLNNHIGVVCKYVVSATLYQRSFKSQQIFVLFQNLQQTIVTYHE